MRHFWRLSALLAIAAALWQAEPVKAQTGNPSSYTWCYKGTGSVTAPSSYAPCSASNPLQITGSISASLGGFTPSAAGARMTPLTVTTSDSSGTLPTGTVVVVSNTGSNPMYCNVNGVAATTSDQYISSSGGWFAFTIPAAITTLRCIATGGSTTANGVGGSGLATGTGGGSGGGGGGGAVTIADGADVAEGATTDAAATAGSTGTVSAKLRLMTTQLDNINTNIQGSIPAGTALIGDVNLRQGGTALSASNGIYANLLVGNAAVGTGTGAVGSTTPRVAVGTDTATVAGTAPATAGIAATGAAPPAGSLQVGAVGSGATGGLMAGIKTCDLHAVYDASDNGSKEMIAAVSGRTIYICGFIMATGGTATNLKLVDGTGTDCATGTPTNLTPAYQLTANDKIGANSAFWNGLKASGTNRAVCVNASAGNAHQAELWYTIQ